MASLTPLSKYHLSLNKDGGGGGNTNFQECMTRFWGHMYARSVTSDLGCQSPEEGQRIDRKFEVCPNFCVEIISLDSIFIDIPDHYFIWILGKTFSTLNKIMFWLHFNIINLSHRPYHIQGVQKLPSPLWFFNNFKTKRHIVKPSTNLKSRHVHNLYDTKFNPIGLSKLFWTAFKLWSYDWLYHTLY